MKQPNFTWGSRCAECGKPMPSGTVQRCSKGGWCSHHIPEAARESMANPKYVKPSGEILARCTALAEESKVTANKWVSEFANDYSGKVAFCLALATSISIMRNLVPVLEGTGQDFIDAVRAGTVVYVECEAERKAEGAQ